MSAAPIVSNHVIGMVHIESGDGTNAASIDLWGMQQTGSGAANSMIPACILEAEPSSGDNVGYDTLYVAASTGGIISFGTTVIARGGASATATTVETDKGSNDDPNADLIFAVGDVLHSATDDVLGTLTSIGTFGSSKQDLGFSAGITDTIADNEEIFNVNPLRLILSFEK